MRCPPNPRLSPLARLSRLRDACAGTPLQGSKLVILDLPVIVHCAKCDVRRTLDSPHWLVCPVCETPAPQLVQGKELEIAALELIEQEDSELEMHT
jgi:Zn finger protein HypA/HybF involved in hydrogenase expression